MKLPFGMAAYRRTDSHLPEIVCKNQFVERAPANLEGELALLARPGLTLSYTLGTGPIRALYRADGVFGGDILAVSGTGLYRGQTLVGTIAGTDRVDVDGFSPDADTSTAYIAAGATFYSTDGTTVSTVTFPDNAPVVSVAVVSDITVAVRGDTGVMYFLLPGLTVWDGLNFFSAEQQADPVIAVRKVGDELWAFGTQTVQPFNTTGDNAAPFTPIIGRDFQKGCRSRDTIALLDNTAFWVGSDGAVYRAGGASPERVSDNGIEERIGKVPASDLRAWYYPWNGHSFYCLTIGDEGTFVFDVETAQWHEAASYGYLFWRAHLGVVDNLTVYVGDAIDGKIGVLDGESVTDYGQPVERRFTSGIVVPGPIPCDAVELDAVAGFADGDPVIEMRKSDDWGNTWSSWRSAGLGSLGQYRKRVIWRRNGMIDRARVFDFRLTDAAPWRLSAVRMNESNAGSRGR
ncbi:MAG: hypothetical protein ACM3W4_02045 [Ignavibacteriales bacterium]